MQSNQKLTPVLTGCLGSSEDDWKLISDRGRMAMMVAHDEVSDSFHSDQTKSLVRSREVT